MIYFSDFGTSTFDPATLFTGGEIGDYWKFDIANTDASASGDPVTAATGLVNGYVLEDQDPAKVPQISVVSGNECTTFDSPSDRLIYNFGSTISQPGTIILCMASSYSTATARAIVTGSSTTSRWQINNDGSSNIIMFGGSSLDSTRNIPVGSRVLTCEFNGSSSRFRINGGGVNTDVTGNAGTQGTDRLTIGALYDGTLGMGFNAYSMIFINRILTSTELDNAERFLGAHAGLSW